MKKKSAKIRKVKTIIKKLLLFTQILAIFGLVIVVIMGFNKYKSYISLNYLNKSINNYFVDTGFILQNVFLEGQINTPTTYIVKAIGIKVGQSIFTKKPSLIKRDLEDIGWIKSAAVDREFPSTLYVGIKERTPIGILQSKNKFYLFDREGIKIASSNIKKFIHLPLIISDDITIYVNNIYNILITEPELYHNITSIIRVSERRWNIRTKERVEIKMPEKNFAKAWHKVARLKKKLDWSKIVTIDLRYSDKAFIEKKVRS